ncbi:YidH family protein [Streptomyces sp. NPDC004051]
MDEHDGTEPDYRFTLANERTFLAWVRTAVSLLAAAVAVRQLVPPFSVPHAREILAVVCAFLAFVIAVRSYPHWRRAQRAIRRGGPLPGSRLLPVLAAALAAVAAFTTALVWVGDAA